MFQVGTKVNVLIQSDKLPGKVCGHAFIQSDYNGQMEPSYIIRLDQGMWTEHHVAFIDTIVVHYVNVQEVE